MKIVAISDTHCHEPELPSGDVLVHAGDLTIAGSRAETEAAMLWLGREAKKYAHVLFTPGNHDFFLYHMWKQMWSQGGVSPQEYIEHATEADNVRCVIDAGVTIDSVNFYLSPWQPWFYDFAFNAQRGPDIKQYWDKIPTGVDVLVTHGPPKNILDWVGRDRVGCQDLADAVKRTQPRAHIFGHIHSPGGMSVKGVSVNECKGTTFYNAALVDDTYQLAHEPHIINL